MLLKNVFYQLRRRMLLFLIGNSSVMINLRLEGIAAHTDMQGVKFPRGSIIEKNQFVECPHCYLSTAQRDD